MQVTKVEGMVMIDFLVTPEPDVDGFFGVGVLLRDRKQEHFATYFYVADVVDFLVGLHGMGVEYEIRDESLDIAVPTLLGVERIEQTREFIRPGGFGSFVPVVKRVELGSIRPDDFHQRAIPARTT